MNDALERSNEIGNSPGSALEPVPPRLPKNEPPAPSADPGAFASKAEDLQALRDAVVDAASVSGGLWLSYLFVFFYLSVAAFGVTQRDLLLENPVKLPFLNVEVPLTAFFVFGPLLFVIVHGYTLVHFRLFAGKVGAFKSQFEVKISNEETRAGLSRQLPINIFVQFLAGPPEARSGPIRAMLQLTIWISLVVGPIGLLMLFQLQFLPYHSEPITWWQRVLVCSDLFVLWLLWPPIASGTIVSPRWHHLRHREVLACVAAAAVPLVFIVVTFPEEWLARVFPPLRIIPIFGGWVSPHDLLLAGELFVGSDDQKRRVDLRSLWSDRLVVPNIDVIDHTKLDAEDKIAAVPETLSLRGRRLEGAKLESGRLRKVDFTDAHLRGAWLVGADLRETKWGNADLRDAALWGAQLQGASMRRARMWGAWLPHAQLQGASLDWAELQGARLWGAHLEGASFRSAQLQGASLDDAELQAASLAHAHLQGPSLLVTELQGASLVRARLLGAIFDNAGLQGASLDAAELQGASFSHVFAWRADVRSAQSEGAMVVAPETRPRDRRFDCPDYQGEPDLFGGSVSFAAAKARIEQRQLPPSLRELSLKQICADYKESPADWSVESFAALKAQIEREVPTGSRDIALKRTVMLDPANPQPGEEAMAEVWNKLAQSPPPPEVYEKTAQTLDKCWLRSRHRTLRRQ